MAYDRFVTTGGEGKANYKRAASWGYDVGDERELFDAACGGGCPLRLPGGPREGESVLDLGCGAGHDVVLASRMVGTGRVYGLDLTQAMLDQTRANVQKYAPDARVDLILGAIDSNITLPRVDVVVSNGAFNLCFDKPKAFKTAFRALKPGGRFLLCDVCEVPDTNDAMVSWRNVGERWSNWVAGCVEVDAYLAMMRSAGFVACRALQYTNFWTSSHTRGVDFVAYKPSRLRRPAFVLLVAAFVGLIIFA